MKLNFPKLAFCGALLGSSLLTTGAAKAATLAQPIALTVDASDPQSQILHITETIPVSGSAVTLDYPKWIPGEHSPSGPIEEMVGLHVYCNGQELPWRRDLLEMFSIHVALPAGASQITVKFDQLCPSSTEGFGASKFATPEIFVLEWNQVLVTPHGYGSHEVTVNPTLMLPHGWGYGTALPPSTAAANQLSSADADVHTFAPVLFYNLVDSPVISGANFRAVDITPAGEPIHHELDLAADHDYDLEMPAAEINDYKNLVSESYAVFGSRHYRDYHFLVTLSNHVSDFGLEHHESSDDRTQSDSFTDETGQRTVAELLPHEFVHSWNGKYRRPAGLYVPNYIDPEQTDLLWVYEGLTEFYGSVLAARSGLEKVDYYHERLALTLANLSAESGRTWRPLQDTADEAQILYYSPNEWGAYRRGTDFYEEDVLNWLDVDMRIRQLTGGKKSLDDFAKLFYGPAGRASGVPDVHPYKYEEVITNLNQIAPYDWDGFWKERLNTKAPQADAAGVNASGWTLTFTDQPNTNLSDYQTRGHFTDATYSLGMNLGHSGEISDVTPGGLAFKAGLVPGMKIIAINGEGFSGDDLDDILKREEKTTTPMQVLTEQDDMYKTYALDYHGGPKYPHLVATPGATDNLALLLKPHAAQK